MLKKGVAVLLILGAVYWSFMALMPSKVTDANTPLNEFSTLRALAHLEVIAQRAHPLGSEDHGRVRNYLIKELQKLGLTTEIQEGYAIRNWGNLAKPKNIIARLKGSEEGKSLLLLSHYDSAHHSAVGASDAGSGVVTILEGLRAFLSEEKVLRNDIIVVFTDSEELGLNGANLFVNKHPWSQNVGLVLNFEARGSGGPSYMLIETNGGNANFIKEFIKANPDYPVANSLMYSIYKMLPNDSDLTRFREDGDIDGFNFAFIGDHYDYHTSRDNFERLDRETLEHQGSYLMPLLHHFAENDVSNLKSLEDLVYFNVPALGLLSYPFTCIIPMLILTVALFMVLLLYGLKRGRLSFGDIGRGFVPFLLSLICAVVIGLGLWKTLIFLYPNYSEMLHGFTYNGYTYIWSFSLLSLGVCFWLYGKFYKPGATASFVIAPIIFWIVICSAIALKLKGASFFVIPTLFALLSLFILIRQRKPNLILMALICFPLLMIMSPFIQMFPVGLGLKNLVISCVFVVLIFGLLVSVFGFLKHQRRWGSLLIISGLMGLVIAHINSDFNEDNAKPNSLVYVLDLDKKEANWATYDKKLDDWTMPYFESTLNSMSSNFDNVFASKYNTRFNYISEAPLKNINSPKDTIYSDTVIDGKRHISLKIEQQRTVSRFDVYADPALIFEKFALNGVSVYIPKGNSKPFENRESDRLFTYYVTDNEPLHMEFVIPYDQQTAFDIYESSNDLLSNSLFSVPPRRSDMITKPFVLNDAVILKKRVDIN
jgi:hypothetical protein